MSTLLEKANAIKDEKDEKILPENIKKDVQIFDVVGTLESGIDTSDATATSMDLPVGITAYARGEKINGALFKYTDCEMMLSYGGYSNHGPTIDIKSTPKPPSNPEIYGPGVVQSIIVNKAETGLIAENIKKDVNIFGVVGTLESGSTINNQDKTITSNGSYTADQGYTGLGTVTVNVPSSSSGYFSIKTKLMRSDISSGYPAWTSPMNKDMWFNIPEDLSNTNKKYLAYLLTKEDGSVVRYVLIYDNVSTISADYIRIDESEYPYYMDIDIGRDNYAPDRCYVFPEISDLNSWWNSNTDRTEIGTLCDVEDIPVYDYGYANIKYPIVAYSGDTVYIGQNFTNNYDAGDGQHTFVTDMITPDLVKHDTIAYNSIGTAVNGTMPDPTATYTLNAVFGRGHISYGDLSTWFVENRLVYFNTPMDIKDNSRYKYLAFFCEGEPDMMTGEIIDRYLLVYDNANNNISMDMVVLEEEWHPTDRYWYLSLPWDRTARTTATPVHCYKYPSIDRWSFKNTYPDFNYGYWWNTAGRAELPVEVNYSSLPITSQGLKIGYFPTETVTDYVFITQNFTGTHHSPMGENFLQLNLEANKILSNGFGFDALGNKITGTLSLTNTKFPAVPGCYVDTYDVSNLNRNTTYYTKLPADLILNDKRWAILDFTDPEGRPYHWLMVSDNELPITKYTDGYGIVIAEDSNITWYESDVARVLVANADYPTLDVITWRISQDGPINPWSHTAIFDAGTLLLATNSNVMDGTEYLLHSIARASDISSDSGYVNIQGKFIQGTKN